MVKRKRLGIRFDISYKTATGAVIYFMNIINALRVLPDDEKPEVYAFVSPDAPVEMIREIDYPYLTILPIKYPPLWQRALNRIYRKIVNGKKFNLFTAPTYTGEMLDAVLSLVIPSEDINTRKQLLWIADLQIYHLPDNYTAEEIKLNHNLQVKILKGGYDIVLCSQWCIDDFNLIFPGHKSAMHRLRFTTNHPNFSNLNPEEIKKKYHITHPYFIVSNQFWIHKNHIAVLKAINTLKEEYPDICCIITGHPKVMSSKSKGYVEGLTGYIKENKLEKHIQFLGLIPREDQLCLMKNSLAIVQPSYFESWNTTVEDAKALGKFIILSDLTVHKEQISENVYFFNPDKASELAAGMKMVLQQHPMNIVPYDYDKDVKAYAKSIVKMLD